MLDLLALFLLDDSGPVVGTAKKIAIGNEITIGDVSFKVSGRFDDAISEDRKSVV